jgi:hypothetical protein
MVTPVEIRVNNIACLFSNQYPIIVQLLFSILILEIFSTYFDPDNNNYRLSQ